MLYYIIVAIAYYFALCFKILCYNILYFILLCCIILFYAMLSHIVLDYIKVIDFGRFQIIHLYFILNETVSE